MSIICVKWNNVRSLCFLSVHVFCYISHIFCVKCNNVSFIPDQSMFCNISHVFYITHNLLCFIYDKRTYCLVNKYAVYLYKIIKGWICKHLVTLELSYMKHVMFFLFQRNYATQSLPSAMRECIYIVHKTSTIDYTNSRSCTCLKWRW